MTPVEQDFIDHLDKIEEHGVRGLVWVRNVQPEIAWIGHNLTTTVDLGGWHEPTEITKGRVRCSRPRSLNTRRRARR